MHVILLYSLIYIRVLLSLFIDINECGGLRRCEQACNNMAGSYQCACLPGYTLAANAISCQGYLHNI